MTASSQQRQQQPQRRSRAWATTLLLLRLVVTAIGLGLAIGTVLKLVAPSLQQTERQQQPGEPREDTSPRLLRGIGSFQPRQELTALSERFASLTATQPDLRAGAYMVVLDDGSFAQLNPTVPYAAASSIKLPILLLLLQDVGDGRIDWNQRVIMRSELIGGGAGWMQGQPAGSSFPLYEVARDMIRVSDNTATNMIVDLLGGKEAVNRRWQDLGLTSTVLNNWLPDLGGTNTSSAEDLCRSLALAELGEQLDLRNRDRFREIMASSRTDSLLPAGFLTGLGGARGRVDEALREFGSQVLNKTGDIGTAYVDAAQIELPDGRRALAAFMVVGSEQTEYNSPRSRQLIRDLATATAQALLPLDSTDITP